MTRTRRLLAGSALLALVTTGCSADPEESLPDAEPVAVALASGLAAGDLGDVPLTQETAAGAAAYPDIVEGMDGARVTVTGEPLDVTEATETEPASGHVALRWSWDLGGHPWTYETQASITLGEDETWQVAWAPAIVEPSLDGPQVLDRVGIAAARGPILGAGDTPLITRRAVVRFGIDRTMVAADRAGSSAKKLAKLLGIEVAPYVEQVEAAGDKAFVEALVLRQEDVPEKAAQVEDIQGARAIQDEADLGPSADFAVPLLGRVGPVTAEMVAEDPERYQAGDVAGLSGLEARYDGQLRGADGVSVDAISTDGKHREVFRVDAIDGEALTTTLDEDLQFAAEKALADTGPAAALVAVQPSTGAVLAAANGPGTNGVNIATYGQAAPGSTFKLVSSLALLRAGVQPNDPLECPSSIVVDGKTFTNYSDYPPSGIGRISLRTAVANSCNTAFIGARGKLGDPESSTALADAAASLGFGVDHDLGAPAYFGQVPPPESETEAAADLIGQGSVLASPMAMATVMASVQWGRTVVPQIVTSVPVEVPDGVEELTQGEGEALRSLARAVVTDGSGAALLDLPGPAVIAKTGTAEFDRDGRRLTHAWMVAAQGDLAVAVYVDEGASGSRTAGPILEQFLRAAASL